MKNALLRSLVCLAIAAIAPETAAGAAGDTCVPLPAHRPKVGRHGHDHWSDETLLVSGAISSGVVSRFENRSAANGAMPASLRKSGKRRFRTSLEVRKRFHRA